MTSYSDNAYYITNLFCCFGKFLAYTLFLPSFHVFRHQMVKLNWGASPSPLNTIVISRTLSKIGLKYTDICFLISCLNTSFRIANKECHRNYLLISKEQHCRSPPLRRISCHGRSHSYTRCEYSWTIFLCHPATASIHCLVENFQLICYSKQVNATSQYNDDSGSSRCLKLPHDRMVAVVKNYWLLVQRKKAAEEDD